MLLRAARAARTASSAPHWRITRRVLGSYRPQGRAMATNITYLTQQQAADLDAELMGPLGFSVDQLMELAGLSVACAAAAEFPLPTHAAPLDGQRGGGNGGSGDSAGNPSGPTRVAVLAGPGNNGGDGLVAARHLWQFGYAPTICYPKPTDKALYNGLVTQCRALGIPFVSADELLSGGPLAQRFDFIIDALFGFSFKGEPRPPFDRILQALAPAAAPPPIVAVDIPSGWDVEAGDAAGGGMRPAVLVSLTAPKLAARHFTGAHYLGGRFVPPPIRERYGLVLPPYPGASQVVRLPALSSGGGGSGAVSGSGGAGGGGAVGAAPADMRITYDAGALGEADVAADPFRQFDVWFKEAAADARIEEPNAIAVATADAATGAPSVRMVLLKAYDARGFVFYTNYTSRKGRELAGNARVAFTMWWEPLQRQIRVEGAVERVEAEEADAYFASRPRGSQIGAWASEQSQPAPGGRAQLEAAEAAAAERFASGAVPRPPHWGGFRIVPSAIEFWQGRSGRLHDRLRYTRGGGGEGGGEWSIERLQP